jgi:hypothetical protein
MRKLNRRNSPPAMLPLMRVKYGCNIGMSWLFSSDLLPSISLNLIWMQSVNCGVALKHSEVFRAISMPSSLFNDSSL